MRNEYETVQHCIDVLRERIGGDPDAFAMLDDLVTAYRRELHAAIRLAAEGHGSSKAQGVAEERERIAAWLRDIAGRMRENRAAGLSICFEDVASTILRGGHSA